MATVLVIRPEPGAASTAASLRAAGHRAITAPIFTSVAVDWAIPDGVFDAVMLTSEAAPRLAGPGAGRFVHLPTYCIGSATFAAASAAGFTNVRPGPAGVAALVNMIIAEGHQHILHLAARDRTPVPPEVATMTTCTVYAAEAGDLSDEALSALNAGEIDWVLLFSKRSATEFKAACRNRASVSVAAISADVATAAGPGWRNLVIAAEASELAVLAAAGLTCDKSPSGPEPDIRRRARHG